MGRRRRRSSDEDAGGDSATAELPPKRRRGHRHDDRDIETSGRRAMVDFEKFRSKLSKMFFRDEDLIQQGSDEYNDFWKFLRKYQAMQGQKDLRERTQRQKELWRQLNFRLLPRDAQELLNRIPPQDPEDEDAYRRCPILTVDLVEEFQQILCLYIDFLQREKMAKLKKLRQGQANLPIAEYKNHILSTIRKHQIVIVAGDTGCGKSTQLPQYLLRDGYTKIACTQPRRIACISLAKRVGYETLNEYGSEIGYQIRFEKHKSERTRVLFLTEGLLLRQVATDPMLSAYSVIVLDEVHERHLQGDFLLGIVKCLVQQRLDLKVVLMSATINIKLFQDYFHGEAPVIQVPGRLFPIQLKYHPIPAIEESSSEKLNPAPYVRILQLIDRKYPESERGDVLIFLSGIREITTVVDACREYAERNNRWIILPLHSTLSLSEQDKVFDYAPDGVRKCVVSTNIAETSVTIDGIRFVVDSGKAKEMQYDPVCKMQRLKEFWVSRASAEQRKGRSGRTGPGVCFRLFSEAEYKALAPYSQPEIQRVPLDNLILQMISMGLPDARLFPFIEPPPPESIENSILVLKEQEALNEDESLTVIGRTLANLPVDVSIGKMLIMGTLFHQVESVLSLASALSVQSPFTNQAYRDSDCVAARRNLDSDHGDPITLLNSFREWLQIKAEQYESSRKWCKKRGLEEQRFYEMTKLRAQFKELLEQSGLLQKNDFSYLSSAERAERHGELRHLRSMKREYLKTEAPRKRRTLKVRTIDDLEADDAHEAIDMKDIEFRMRNDGRKVRDILEGTKAYSYKDLNMLKLILASGLYPQLAVGDEFNQCKSGADQLFHTRVKPFNVLHPNCIFAASPEYLTLESSDTISVAGFPSKFPISAKHQILVYLGLLETNKPYLVNVMRMPALQTLLLFSHCIASNVTFSRIVFDSWLELRFPYPEHIQNSVWKASRLRQYWSNLLTLQLEGQDTSPEEDNGDPIGREEERKFLENKLSQGLMAFIHTEMPFTMRRLLPGDVKVLYTRTHSSATKESELDENPFGSKDAVKRNDKLGGWNLTPFLVYDCLESTGNDLDAVLSSWACPFCEQSMYCDPLTRLSHYGSCHDKHEAQADAKDKAQQEAKKPRNPLAKHYSCSECNKTLFLTPTEILRHKRQHQEMSSETAPT